MGYTQFTKDKVQGIIDIYNPKSAIDLGAQNDFSQPNLPAPFISDWYGKQNIGYTCIDLNGENGAFKIDLSKPISANAKVMQLATDMGLLSEGNNGLRSKYSLLVDAGTSEHIGDNGKFSWEAIYNCWVTKHTLLDMGGIMYSENPKTNNWVGHGFNYYVQEFYKELAAISGYEILDIGEHPACNNITDGWNIWATMKKVANEFPSFEEFKKLPIYKQ